MTEDQIPVLPRQQHVPRFVKVIAVGVVILLVLAVTAAWQISNVLQDQQQQRCMVSVQARADNRVMWEWLGRQFPEGAQEVHLQKQLDHLVPPLACVDGELVEVDPMEGNNG